MHRIWALPALLLAVACATAPPPSPEGAERPAQEEWLRLRLREADGRVHEESLRSRSERWREWSAGHALPAKASPLGVRTWQEIGPRNVAGRVLSVALDPNAPDVIWAGSAGGGLWKSENFGQTWKQVGGDHLPSLWISAVAVDPHDSRIVYMGTGEANDSFDYDGFGGMLKTADGGRTFTRIPLPEGSFYRTVVSPADSRLVLTSTPGGLYRSADAGGHFAKVLPGKVTDFAQDPNDPARFLAVRMSPELGSADGGLFESLDAGLSWHALGTGLPSGSSWGRSAIAFPPAPSSTIYIAVNAYNALGPTLFRSTDGGRTWEVRASQGKNGYSGVGYYGAHLAAPASGSLFQANGSSILVSRDGGLNWTQPGGNWHSDTHGIAVDLRNSSRIVFATDGGVAVSTDSGSTFGRADRGFPTVQLYTCAFGLRDPFTAFGGTQDNALAIYRGASGGAWETSHPPLLGDVTAISVNPARPGEMVTVSAQAWAVGLSGDEGVTWRSIRDNALPTGYAYPWVARLARSPLSPNRVYMAQGHVFDTSSDGGATWQATQVRPPFNDLATAITDLSASPVYESEIWTIWKDGKVLVTGNGGLDWIDRSPPADSRAGIRVSAGPAPGSAYAILSGTTGPRLFRTRDEGLTWDDISRDLPQVALNAVLPDPKAPGRLLVATDAGVALSTDDGATWRDASAGLPNAVVFDLCQDPASGRLGAATYGRGLWELKDAPPSSCIPDGNTLCLNGGRFEVKATWTTPAGASGQADAEPLTADTGYFHFFDPANVEAMVKVIDACGYNGRFWVYAGGLTDLATTLTVRDTRTGDVRTYANPQGRAFQPIQDSDAFAGCDVASVAAAATAATGKSVSGTSLLLNGDRFKLDVTWETPDGKSGRGMPVALTSDTGYFWFFDAGNVEMVIKVLRGCGVNGSYWVYAGGLTNVRTVLTVTDTATGKVKTYVNPQGRAFQPIQDTSAFPVCK
jgi:photosystem II stability/assembly factor-like uncharacterized protein